MTMKLDETVDADIRISLEKNDLKYALDTDGRIQVHQYRMDTKAKTGMLYLKPENEIPDGGLPFLIVNAKGVYGVFHEDGNALMIEVSFMAMVGEITDSYGQS